MEKKIVDSEGAFRALMADLSKAFDCLSHELSIAKLDACGFDKKSLKFIYSCLSNRKQRVKINDSYSSWGKFYSEFLKVQYLEDYSSTFLYLICSTSYKIMELEITQMR